MTLHEQCQREDEEVEEMLVMKSSRECYHDEGAEVFVLFCSTPSIPTLRGRGARDEVREE